MAFRSVKNLIILQSLILHIHFFLSRDHHNIFITLNNFYAKFWAKFVFSEVWLRSALIVEDGIKMISEGEGIAFYELYFRYLYHAFSLAQTLDSGLAPSHFYFSVL